MISFYRQQKLAERRRRRDQDPENLCVHCRGVLLQIGRGWYGRCRDCGQVGEWEKYPYELDRGND
jgi:hypothetical protein